MKKIQRKAKQEADTKSPGDKDKEGKDDRIVKQESPSSEHGQYLGLGGLADFSTSSQPLNPNIPYSPDGNYCLNNTIIILLFIFLFIEF